MPSAAPIRDRLAVGSRATDNLPNFVFRRTVEMSDNSAAEGAMAYEYPTTTGVLRLLQIERQWVVQFNCRQSGQWRSPDAAAIAVAQHKCGLSEWDCGRSYASEDLLDWRPLAESL